MSSARFMPLFVAPYLVARPMPALVINVPTMDCATLSIRSEFRPGKAQAVLDRCKALWLATSYTSPKSSSFGTHNVLSITIACAREWGWRS